MTDETFAYDAHDRSTWSMTDRELFDNFPHVVWAAETDTLDIDTRVERRAWVIEELRLVPGTDFTYVYDMFRFRDETKAAMFMLRWG